MNEQLARFLALLSGAFLLRSAVLIIAVLLLVRTMADSTTALRDVERADAATELRLKTLEADYLATIHSLAIVKHELVEVWRRETQLREERRRAEERRLTAQQAALLGLPHDDPENPCPGGRIGTPINGNSTSYEYSADCGGWTIREERQP